MINHRGPEYAEMLDQMSSNLKTVFMTNNDVYFITASGTGAMEAAVVNTVSPGDKVLSIIIGALFDLTVLKNLGVFFISFFNSFIDLFING